MMDVPGIMTLDGGKDPGRVDAALDPIATDHSFRERSRRGNPKSAQK
jgi:hypothetical protein